MEENGKVIHFHIKSRSVPDLAFMQRAFEKCTRNFYFENGEVGLKRATAN